MDNVQNCDSSINISSSQTYRSNLQELIFISCVRLCSCEQGVGSKYGTAVTCEYFCDFPEDNFQDLTSI
jgi:hypothetical protein